MTSHFPRTLPRKPQHIKTRKKQIGQRTTFGETFDSVWVVDKLETRTEPGRARLFLSNYSPPLEMGRGPKEQFNAVIVDVTTIWRAERVFDLLT